MVRKSYNNGSYVAYTYNAEGSLARLSYGDSTGELASYRFEYDSLGRLIRSAELDADGGTVQRTEHIYDGYNRLSRQSWTLGSKTYSESYVYDDPSDTNKNGDGALTQMTTATGAVIGYQYDTLRRLTRSEVALNGSTIYTTAYAFRDLDASRTTTQVQYRNVRNANGEVLEGKKYTYDALGNITRISQSTKPFYTLVAYEYDAQNQLTKETYYDGKGTATKNIKLAYYYDYDTAGNILRVEKGTVNSSGVLTKTVEQTYSYNDSDWNDLLTSVNVNGTTYNFTYDQSGNPERYFTKNGLEYVLDWKNGSQLAYSSCFDEQWQAAYYYDANGIRRQKRLEGDVTNYTTQNGKVIREETSSRYSATCILDFVYDESGRPFALYYSSNGGNSFATYYYILNLQGDVVKLVTESGAVAASYEYDAWGNILSSTGSMARTNPLRYRGYYYDVETGFYYLQSRYYDPANRRFINADVYASTGQGFVGTNMFAYCNSNPVSNYDAQGRLPHTNLIASDSGKTPIKTKIICISSKQKYSRKNWDSLSVEDRKQLLNEYAKEVAQAMNICINGELRFYMSEDNTTGEYSPTGNYISLNEKWLDFGYFKTVRHEMRHAYQHAAVVGLDVFGYKNPYPENYATRRSWSHNMENYYSPKYGDLYRYQPIEADAYDWAAETGAWRNE